MEARTNSGSMLTPGLTDTNTNVPGFRIGFIILSDSDRSEIGVIGIVFNNQGLSHENAGWSRLLTG
jgi:hypothetical protein